VLDMEMSSVEDIRVDLARNFFKKMKAIFCHFNYQRRRKRTGFMKRMPVTVQTRLKPRGVFRGFFAKNPSGTARAAREAYWNRRAQRYMSTPFEGAWTVTNALTIRKGGGDVNEEEREYRSEQSGRNKKKDAGIHP